MTLLDTWNILKNKADKADAELLGRLETAYTASYGRIKPEVDALIEYLEAHPGATRQQVQKSAVYKNLMREVVDELDDYQAYLKTEISTEVTESGKRGAVDGKTLLVAAIALSLGVSDKDIPADTTKGLTSLDFLEKYLQKGSPLFQRINGLSDYHGEQIADGILKLVSAGQNPRVIGDWMVDAYGMGLTDSMRIARTVQLYSYREANNAVQVANADLLQGVVWCAEMDDRTCLSCISLHGQVFPVGTICNDHHNGRCAMLPWTKESENPIQQTGEQWFGEQSEATQKNMMGEAKWQAWKDGKFEFGQLSKDYHDDVYGMMKGEASLKSLLGGENE